MHFMHIIRILTHKSCEILTQLFVNFFADVNAYFGLSMTVLSVFKGRISNELQINRTIFAQLLQTVRIWYAELGPDLIVV